MTKCARNLVVVIVDDNETVQMPDGLDPYYDIHRIFSYRDVSRAILDSTREFRKADLLVLDVNMADMRLGEVEPLNWGTDSDLVPFGPMLALPYLGTNKVMGFGFVSSYWRAPSLPRCGFAVLSFSFLLSRMESRAVTLEDAQTWLLNAGSGGGVLAPGSIDSAFPNAIHNYRKVLSQSDVDVLDFELMVTQLEHILTETEGKHIPLPLVDSNGDELCFGIGYRTQDADWIGLTSFVGDILELPRANPSRVPRMYVENVLNEIKSFPHMCAMRKREGGSSPKFCSYDDDYEKASALLATVQEQAMSLAAVVRGDPKSRRAFSMDEKRVVRLCVLMAWAYAWNEWIEDRRWNDYQRDALLQSVLAHLGVTTKKEYTRMLRGSDKKDGVLEGVEAMRVERHPCRPFLGGDVADMELIDMYCLPPTESIDVSRWEVELCLRYLVDTNSMGKALRHKDRLPPWLRPR